MLEALNITAGYERGRDVLVDANVHVESGSRVALLGANGSGKTTLLRCLSGAHKPSSGRVALDGVELMHKRAGMQAHRQRVQLVLQDPDDQLFSADVTQDVAFGPLNLGLSDAEALTRVHQVLDDLGISHLADRPTHQLSYGERKRVTIAGAMAMRPDYLLLDEPTAGLDPQGVEEIRRALDSLDTTVVLATHEVDFALNWADEAAVVVGGRVVQGSIIELLSNDQLLTSAHLRQPWQLELARRLGLHGRPTTMDEVIAMIRNS